MDRDGIPRTPMPAFSPRLGDDEIWKVVQFLRAQSDAVEAATLTARVEPWRSAILAPDFSFELGGQGQQSLREAQGAGATLLVFYTSPQSLPYLRALTVETANFGAIGLRVVAGSDLRERRAGGRVIRRRRRPDIAVAHADVIAAYAMLAHEEGAAPGAMPSQVDYLIDRRATCARAGSASPTRRPRARRTSSIRPTCCDARGSALR